ncbi:MAG: ATP-binding protein [Myxococcales bacterium]|nr:ATP-binding protein [Myxococcales bacterium]
MTSHDATGPSMPGAAARPLAACQAADADVACAICHGDGFTTGAGADQAEARLCAHLAACPACRGSGWRRTRDAGGYEVVEPCDLRLLLHRIGLFNAAGIPAAYHAATLAGYDPRGGNQSEVRMRFADLQKRLEAGVQPGGKVPVQTKGIGLSGPPGVGKTHLLVAMARHLALDLGVAVRFTDFSRLLWSLKAGFSAGQGEAQLIQPLADVEVLFLDEMGKGRASEWEIGVLDALVCARYDRGLLTFFATNFAFGPPDLTDYARAEAILRDGGTAAVETLGERVTERILSRLQAMCALATLQGDDRRPQTWARPPGRSTGPIGARGTAPPPVQRRPG